IACSALAARTTGTIPISVMNARISFAVIAHTLTRGSSPGESHDAVHRFTPASHMSINDQLERILNTPPLVSSPSLSRFLRYVVEETVAGRSGAIKEYTLGLNVFDRGEEFNPRLDPIVRVQARNLRSRLEKYYETQGTEDPIRIELPKGTYVPLFHYRTNGTVSEDLTREVSAEVEVATPATATT